MFANAGLALVKWLAGFFGNSYALIADAIESATDVFSSLMVLLGLKYASKPPDKNHPYGHGKAEPLVTFLLVGSLVASACIIAYHSIHNIFIPHDLPKPFTLYVLGAIIVTKEIFYRIVRRRSREIKSSSLNADAWHHRSDAITSLAAFIGISIALYMGKGYEAADDWAALFSSVIILYNSYLIFRPALGEIMDEDVYEEMESRIRAISETVEGVVGTEKCRIRKTGMSFHVDLHVIVDPEITVRQGHEIAHRLKDRLKKDIPEIADTLIHIEPNE
jgi:cation diffusion facilitator family transporter